MAEIEHIGSYQFRVASSSGKPPYEVDLTENNFHGTCTCDDYRFRRMKEGARCKHINAVIFYLGEMVIKQAKGQ